MHEIVKVIYLDFEAELYIQHGSKYVIIERTWLLVPDLNKTLQNYRKKSVW